MQVAVAKPEARSPSVQQFEKRFKRVYRYRCGTATGLLPKCRVTISSRRSLHVSGGSPGRSHARVCFCLFPAALDACIFPDLLHASCGDAKFGANRCIRCTRPQTFTDRFNPFVLWFHPSAGSVPLPLTWAAFLLSPGHRYHLLKRARRETSISCLDGLTTPPRVCA